MLTLLHNTKPPLLTPADICAPIPPFSALQPASCGDVKPISNPGERYTCPKLSEYDEAKDETAKPSADTCCRVSTEPLLCYNRQPQQQLLCYVTYACHGSPLDLVNARDPLGHDEQATHPQMCTLCGRGLGHPRAQGPGFYNITTTLTAELVLCCAGCHLCQHAAPQQARR